VNKLKVVLSCLFLAVVLSGAVILIIHFHEPPPDPKTPLLAAQYFVKSKIGPDAIANFSPANWTSIETADQTVTVSGWVEVLARDGKASVTYDYSVVEGKDEGDNWNLIKLDMMPR